MNRIARLAAVALMVAVLSVVAGPVSQAFACRPIANSPEGIHACSVIDAANQPPAGLRHHHSSVGGWHTVGPRRTVHHHRHHRHGRHHRHMPRRIRHDLIVVLRWLRHHR